MTSRRCPDCEFIFLGADAPEEECPECGAVWAENVPLPEDELQTPEAPLEESRAEKQEHPPKSSETASFSIAPLIFGVGLLITTLGWIWQFSETRELRQTLASATQEQSDLDQKLQDSRQRLNEATKELVAEKEATQEAERQRQQLQTEFRESRQQFASERHRLIELERSLSALWQQHGHSHVRSWQIVGPFPFVVPSAETSDSTARAQLTAVETGIVQNGYATEAQFVGLRPNLTWQPFLSDQDRIDLRKACNSDEKAAAFAISWLFSRQEREALLSVGSDDGMKLWFNRKLVHNVDTHRSSSRGQEKIPVNLKSGWNEVLVRIDNRGGGDWNFYAEFRSPNNKESLKMFHSWVKPLTSVHSER